MLLHPAIECLSKYFSSLIGNCPKIFSELFIYEGKVKTYWYGTEMALLSIKYLLCDVGRHVTKMSVEFHFDWINDFLYKVV